MSDLRTYLIKKNLLDKQRSIKESLHHLESKDPLFIDSARSAELGTISWENDVHLNTIALKQSLTALYKNTQEALKKIRQGTYGICSRCGGAISEARLKAFPTANNCLSCL